MIKEKSQIDDGIGLPDTNLSICLLAAWIIIFLVISKGVKSSGKAAYFLALFPYVILIALLVRSVTLEGAKDGIIFFFKPKWSELLNPKVSLKSIRLIIILYKLLKLHNDHIFLGLEGSSCAVFLFLSRGLRTSDNVLFI